MRIGKVKMIAGRGVLLRQGPRDIGSRTEDQNIAFHLLKEASKEKNGAEKPHKSKEKTIRYIMTSVNCPYCNSCKNSKRL